MLRFGAESFEKSTKFEYVGQIGDSIDDFPHFAIAGQGVIGKVRDAKGRTAEGVTSLNGGIVGLWYDPECEVCCGRNGLAIVFSYCDACDNISVGDCDFVRSWTIEEAFDGDRWFVSGNDSVLWGTAAYGTFSMKPNTKKSSFTPAN